MLSQFKQRLVLQQQQQLSRQRLCLDSPQGAWVNVDGQCKLSFTSSDYLGLANDQRIIHALQQGAEHYGVGSGASQQLTGYCTAHRELEMALAKMVGRSHVLLFNSGYHANIGAITALVKRHDAIFHDKLNHASLIDAVQLTRANSYRYRHLDHAHLMQCIDQKKSNQLNFFVTESIFSMDGQVAPLKEIAALAHRHNALLYVDDAHGFGVLGDKGAGTLSQLGLSQDDVPLMMGTLGKACGVSGAFVAGNETLIGNLMQFARTLRYSIAMPAALACAALKSIQIIQEEPWLVNQLKTVISCFSTWALDAKLPIIPSTTPIQSIMLGSNAQALHIADALAKRGVVALAIRPPTVPINRARLRINLTAAHTKHDIEQLISILTESLTHVNNTTLYPSSRERA